MKALAGEAVAWVAQRGGGAPSLHSPTVRAGGAPSTDGAVGVPAYCRVGTQPYKVPSNSNGSVLIYRLDSYIAECSGWRGPLGLHQPSPPTQSRFLHCGTQVSILAGFEYLWISRAQHIFGQFTWK